jgi:hypothetical protein
MKDVTKITHDKLVNFTAVEKHDSNKNLQTPNQQHSIHH